MTTKFLILSLLGVILTSCNNQSKPTEKTIFISSETQPCNEGIRKMDCMQVKWNKSDKEYELFYDEIEGFNYEAGNEYELLITEEKLVNPPADASSVKYKLVKVVSKTQVESNVNNTLKDENLTKMKWEAVSSSLFDDNNYPFSKTKPEIIFSQNGKITGSFCNAISGTYEIPVANKIVFKINMQSTNLQCESNVSLAENFVASGEYEYDIMKGYLTLQNNKGETLTFFRANTRGENKMVN
jgi:heat shock protein HslJ